MLFMSYMFFIPLGTWPVGTYLEAELQCCCWTSKKMSAANSLKKIALSRPTRKKDSSIRIPHSLIVRITSLCDGADLAVTKADLMGLFSSGKVDGIFCNETRKDLKGRALSCKF